MIRVLILCFVCIQIPLLGVVNIESSRKSELGSSQKINAHLSLYGGNTDSIQGSTEYQRFSRSKDWELITLLSYKTGRNNDDSYLNRYMIHQRFVRLEPSQAEKEFYIQRSYDEYANLLGRTLFGAGLRHHIFSSDQQQIYLGTGLLYEDEELSSRQETEFKGFRYALYASYVGRIFNGSLYFQPSIEDTNDYRALFNLSSSVPIQKHLSLQSNIQIRLDSDPFPRQRKWDFNLEQGISIVWD